MPSRIINTEDLVSHGNIKGRADLISIIEAGLQASDPYNNTLRMIRVENGNLIAGGPEFDPQGSPKTGAEVIDLNKIGRIFVFGAGKGVQRVAKGIEDVLGDRLTGGHVIGKHGDEIICRRIGVTLGGHPVPDQYCVEGCERIIEMSRGMTENDLVFTIACNGVSSLLTHPAPGVSIEQVSALTYLMQIDRGAPTQDLNPVRNHLDTMKGGRASRYFQPAMAIHIMGMAPQPWGWITTANVWQHFLPDCTTFEQAVAMLKKWNAWDETPANIRDYLSRADPANETVKADEFMRMRSRVFGVMPHEFSFLPVAMKKAEELGYKPYKLASRLQAEAREAGLVIADIALTCEAEGSPFAPPCALFSSGELLVTVGEETGVGGRNQEFALSAALRIRGSEKVVIGGVDTDGTDGPGGFITEDARAAGIRNLAGGVVDGQTADEARALGVDILSELRRHNTSAALWKLKSGIAATYNISVGDLDVTLIMGRNEKPLYVP